MDANEFREFGRSALELIINYLQNIRERDVLPSTEPRSIINSQPQTMPEQSEHWAQVLKDVEEIILPGLTHWQSPNFHGFFPSASSMGSIIGELLTAGIGALGFTWICSPVCTELEITVMDWLGKFLHLPKHFLHSTPGPGGGVIQGSASEAILIAMIAAREQALQRTKLAHPELSEIQIRGMLLAYTSDQSNSCVEKAGMLAAVAVKMLPTGHDCVLRGSTLQEAVDNDLRQGRIPVICIATLGTTGTCAYDDIESLSKVCSQHNIHLHVDAAYAGAAFALEEYEHLRQGLEKVDSLNFNLHKFLMVNFECAAMWLRDANIVVNNFNVDRIYLQHVSVCDQQSQMPDFRHWQIALGRRFRALKVWITCRTVGAEGFRAHIRKHIALAARLERYLLNDTRFELVTPRALGLICFRPRGNDRYTVDLLSRLTERKKIFLIQASHHGKRFLRFVICGMDPREADIDFAWNEISSQLTYIYLEEEKKEKEEKEAHANTLGILSVRQDLTDKIIIQNTDIIIKNKNANITRVTKDLQQDMKIKCDIDEKSK